MPYELKDISNKSIWENFITSHKEANFLQSWNYGECFKNLGNKIFRLGFYLDGELVGVAFVLKEEAKRGTYLSVAGGPVLDWGKSDLILFFTKEIKKLAKLEKAVFVRMRSQLVDSDVNRKQIQSLGWKKAPVNLEAEYTSILDIEPDVDELLKKMKKNTRYEIRRIEKMGIETEVVSGESEQTLSYLDKFLQHQRELGTKHGFTPFKDDFVKEQFKAFLQDDQVVLVNGYKCDHEGEIENREGDKTFCRLYDEHVLLASAFIIFYNNEAAYHYGISTAANYRLPGAYAVQMRVIEEAKKRACKKYNLWGGLVPSGYKGDHRYKGVDRFKRGFGGDDMQYLPAHDLPVNGLWYSLTKWFELLRKKSRKL